VVETKWLCNYGKGGVEVLANIEEGGWIRVEILDQYGRVIPGWEAEKCHFREGEGGRLSFFWGPDELVGRTGQISDQNGRIGNVIKLRFLLNRATLYGFQAGDEGAMPPYR
ncbi:MAG: hypothetical protein HXS50_05070, partial [Theionarchaea archaeon]|nr:hypothetical protein [Theionarchaea archaeon]